MQVCFENGIQTRIIGPLKKHQVHIIRRSISSTVLKKTVEQNQKSEINITLS